jgi:hypothetical protein
MEKRGQKFEGICEIINVILVNHASRIDNPHIKLITMAVDSVNRITGTRKVIANRNFAKKVEIVAAHICLMVCLFSASFETWIPKASEKASAMAIVRIPARTTIFECVPDGGIFWGCIIFGCAEEI